MHLGFATKGFELIMNDCSNLQQAGFEISSGETIYTGLVAAHWCPGELYQYRQGFWHAVQSLHICLVLYVLR